MVILLLLISPNCSLVTMHISSGVNDSMPYLRFKTNSAFIGCVGIHLKATQSYVWQGDEVVSWLVAANRLIGAPFLIFPLNF